MRDFLQIDPEQVQEDAIQAYETETGEELYAGDERRILINTLAQLFTVAMGKVNDLLNMDFPQYATGTYLDALGARRNVTRIPAQAALTTLQYTLSAVQGTNVTIPAGTRATPDQIHFFETVEALVITAGNLTGTVTAQATVTGEDYNDFSIGSICNQVDLVPLVQSVTNTTASQGGAAIEDDESYRDRILLSLATYSTAGSELSYIYWAKSADSTIFDISAVSPSAGAVTVTVLLENGGIPGQPILDKVELALADRTVRPLSDQVTVQAPSQVNYSITLSYSIDSARQNEVTDIQAAVLAAIDEYVAWQKQYLGRHINPGVLVQKIMNAGAASVSITAPTFTSLDPDEVANLNGAASVTYDGLI